MTKRKNRFLYFVGAILILLCAVLSPFMFNNNKGSVFADGQVTIDDYRWYSLGSVLNTNGSLRSSVGRYFWTDGSNVYLSLGATGYNFIVNVDDLSLEPIDFGATIYGNDVWSDGTYIHYDSGSTHLVFNSSNKTWSTFTWTGLSSFYGHSVKKIGNNYYYAQNDELYIFDFVNSTISSISYTGLDDLRYSLDFTYIWYMNDNVYLSNGVITQLGTNYSVAVNLDNTLSFTDLKISGTGIRVEGNSAFEFLGTNYFGLAGSNGVVSNIYNLNGFISNLIVDNTHLNIQIPTKQFVVIDDIIFAFNQSSVFVYKPLSGGYDDGYQAGYVDGYQAGLSADYQSGYNAGYQAGQTAGYSNGYNAGYQAGLNDNQQTIYQNGYNAGEIAGYNNGYTTGYNAGEYQGFQDGVASTGYDIVDINTPSNFRTQTISLSPRYFIFSDTNDDFIDLRPSSSNDYIFNDFAFNLHMVGYDTGAYSIGFSGNTITSSYVQPYSRYYYNGNQGYRLYEPYSFSASYMQTGYLDYVNLDNADWEEYNSVSLGGISMKGYYISSDNNYFDYAGMLCANVPAGYSASDYVLVPFNIHVFGAENFNGNINYWYVDSTDYATTDLYNFLHSIDYSDITFVPITYHYVCFNGSSMSITFYLSSSPYPIVRSTDYYVNRNIPQGTEYNRGVLDGKQQGYDIGYQDGETKGEEVGFNAGKQQGYNQGVAEANNYSFIGLITSVVDVPVNTFTSLLNFEILGVNISVFIYSLLSITLVLIILRWLKGGGE